MNLIYYIQMEANNEKQALLRKRGELLMELACHSILVEEFPYYSIPVLEEEIEFLDKLLDECKGEVKPFYQDIQTTNTK